MRLEEAKANAEKMGIFERVALQNGQRIIGPSDFIKRLTNSMIIAFGATIASVTLGLFAAYAFSRFEIPGADDLLFFILSGRMLPAVVVAIPYLFDVPAVGFTRYSPGDDSGLYRF